MSGLPGLLASGAGRDLAVEDTDELVGFATVAVRARWWLVMELLVLGEGRDQFEPLAARCARIFVHRHRTLLRLSLPTPDAPHAVWDCEIVLKSTLVDEDVDVLGDAVSVR